MVTPTPRTCQLSLVFPLSDHVSALDMKEKERFVTIGCKILDAALESGFPCRGITQIYGAAGTGKSQLALQMSLTVQLPESVGGLAAAAVYICTEAAFPTKRMQELINKCPTKEYNASGDNIFVEHASTIEQLEVCLINKIPLLMKAHKIGLIVIDSIAAPYRIEDWNDKSNSRAKSLRLVGQQLRKLSNMKDVCVICINQVMSDCNTNKEVPALGITWSSMITQSIYLYRNGPARFISVPLSSYLPNKTIQFEVYEAGIRGIR